MNTIKKHVVGCTFCEIDPSRITNQNTLAYVTPDKYPVTKGHLLIIPKRHVKDYFGLDELESSAIYELILEEKKNLSEDTFHRGIQHRSELWRGLPVKRFFIVMYILFLEEKEM